MKIIVMYENPDEFQPAEWLAQVLPKIGPSLVNAEVDSDGSVRVRYDATRQPIRIRTRVCPAVDELTPFVALRDFERNTIVNTFGVPPAAIAVQGDGRLKNYSLCERCGEPKYDGAFCRCDPRGKLPPVERKPPKETRDLIFPDEEP